MSQFQPDWTKSNAAKHAVVPIFESLRERLLDRGEPLPDFESLSVVLSKIDPAWSRRNEVRTLEVVLAPSIMRENIDPVPIVHFLEQIDPDWTRNSAPFFEELLELLQSNGSQTVFAAGRLRILGRSESAVDILHKQFHDLQSNPTVTATALREFDPELVSRSFLNGHGVTTIQHLVDRLNRSDESSPDAARALGIIGPPAKSAASSLISQMLNSNPKIGAESASSLHFVDPTWQTLSEAKIAMPKILHWIDSEAGDAVQKCAVIRAVTRTGGPHALRTIPRLILLYCESTPEVAESADSTLQAILEFQSPHKTEMTTRTFEMKLPREWAEPKEIERVTKRLVENLRKGQFDLDNQRKGMTQHAKREAADDEYLKNQAWMEEEENRNRANKGLPERIVIPSAIDKWNRRKELRKELKSEQERQNAVRYPASSQKDSLIVRTIRILGLIGRPAEEAVPRLKELAKDQDSLIRDAAQAALLKIEPKDFFFR